MKISMIIPIYNVEKYLEACLETVASQNFPTDEFEIILVNDGSTDNSGNIAESFTNQYENVRLINKANGGLSSARNAGLEIAKGDYVCFVDSDDFISSDYLSKLYDAASQNSADMVFADFHEVDHLGKNLNKDKGKQRYSRGLITQIEAINALTSVGADHFATTVVVAWNKLVKRDIMLKHLYPIGLLHEDEYVIMPLLMDCKSIIWIDDDIYSYRQREASIMQDPSLALKHLVILDVFRERIELSKTLNDQTLTKHLARAYYWDIEVWYYFMRRIYNVPKHKLYHTFTSRMRKQLIKYPRIFGKRRTLDYIIFSISPEFFLKHIYK